MVAPDDPLCSRANRRDFSRLALPTESIDGMTDFGDSRDVLVSLDPAWATLVARVGPCTLVPDRSRSPHESLVRAVAHQQVHARAAAAILGRLEALTPGRFPGPDDLLDRDPIELRSCGFSARKVETLRSLARATLEGLVPTLDEADGLDDETLIARLMTLPGIGRWTVEMWLIFSLGRPDVFPLDDLAIREGVRHFYGLDRVPVRRELARLAEPWRPHRTAASWYLWRFDRG